MNIEDIRSELAKLEPEAEAAWDEYQRMEKLTIPAKEKWYPLHRRCESLRAALNCLEPNEQVSSPKHEP